MDKKEREQELIDELQLLTSQLKILWDFLPIPVCNVNPAFTILETSGAFNTFFAKPKDEILGNNLTTLFASPEIFQKMEKMLSAGKKIANYEVSLKIASAEKPTLVFISAKEDENGDVIGYFIAFIDISSIKTAENELKQRIKELEKFYQTTVNRELKMIDLKKEIKELKAKITSLQRHNN